MSADGTRAASDTPCRLEDPYWGVGLDLSLEEETLKYFPTSNSSREVRYTPYFSATLALRQAPQALGQSDGALPVLPCRSATSSLLPARPGVCSSYTTQA